MTDRITQSWVRNASDEKAVANGCKFDPARGEHVLKFAAEYLRLYEGDCAGQPLIAHDWQIEATMRLFSWIRFSKRWNRWIRRFNAASIWVPKKNKKSPTLAWWALYLLCADGEHGQKVFLGAKDGKQARAIAGEHVIQMLDRSEALSAECTVNRGTYRVVHQPTSSILEPLSSSNERTQKSKEGINGSICIDETHVVDRAFINRISRAGISRSEPLQIEVSTAGNDPEGYGRERYDYGRRVEKGEVDDERLFFLAYAAPQDLSDEDLAADPVKWGQFANPAWGHTVHEEEYLSDYHRSKVSLAQLAEFKMYRLNVWQASAQPWLNMADWSRGRQDYTAEDLKGQECYAGLDLAKTRDTCALALVFPDGTGDETTYRQLVYYWLPRKRAEVLKDKVSYLQWAHDGHIILTDGDTTDYALIRQGILWAIQEFDLRKLAYDPLYGNQLVQRLIEEDSALASDQVVEFRQTIVSFASPTDQYQGLLRDGRLYHPGNACLTWQAGNVMVKPDANHNIRPIKQEYGDHRTIDGVVASIMALALALEPVPEPEVNWL
jgi:phage terminase large subunit-like protein